MKINSLLVPAAFVCLVCSCNLNKSSSDETPATSQPAVVLPTDTSANSNAATTLPVQVAPVQLSQPSSDGSVALNPAHGQPGHDCSIPVGQPLKKTPGTVSPQISTTIPASGAQQSPPTNTVAPPIKPLSGSQVRLNPAHGQPGHRCDIAVGQPLN